jgi:membrane associated rhomboid family serine protease
MEPNPVITAASTPGLKTSPAVGQPGAGQRYPVMTVVFCGICVVVFFGLANEPNANSWEALEKWGYFPPDKIRAGAVWGFITSIFVHQALWHVAFNVYWLYVLGSRMERAIGWWRWLAFCLGAAFVSSGAEFAVSDSTGIGASGVVYAIFGFMWMTRRRFLDFQKVMDSRTVLLFIVWLFVCIAMTVTKVWIVGNSAHVAGLLFGTGIGAWMVWPNRRPLLWPGFALLLLLVVVPLFWAPWSMDWSSEQGNRDYLRGDFTNAVKWYERSMRLGQKRTWCWQNIALSYYAAGDKERYQQTLDSLRTLDAKAADEIERSVQEQPK